MSFDGSLLLVLPSMKLQLRVLGELLGAGRALKTVYSVERLVKIQNSLVDLTTHSLGIISM
jgi:hypothetical protein